MKILFVVLVLLWCVASCEVARAQPVDCAALKQKPFELSWKLDNGTNLRTQHRKSSDGTTETKFIPDQESGSFKAVRLNGYEVSIVKSSDINNSKSSILQLRYFGISPQNESHEVSRDYEIEYILDGVPLKTKRRVREVFLRKDAALIGKCRFVRVAYSHIYLDGLKASERYYFPELQFETAESDLSKATISMSFSP